LLEQLSKISIPIGGPGFIIEILATASEEAYWRASGKRKQGAKGILPARYEPKNYAPSIICPGRNLFKTAYLS
jgi:hypothetical protein